MPIDLELNIQNMFRQKGSHMGGYGSGRPKLHPATNECIQIDTTSLRKHGYLTRKALKSRGGATYTINGEANPQHGFLFEVVCNGEVSPSQDAGHMRLRYDVKCGEKRDTVDLSIPFTVTHPNYGGIRWWFLAPCCGRRARILYLPAFGAHPLLECRKCLYRLVILYGRLHSFFANLSWPAGATAYRDTRASW